MSKRPVELLLEDILDAIEKIGLYTSGLNRKTFQENEMTADAVVRNLELIGEASSRLPLEFRRENQRIEWAKIIGLRNRIIHEYFGVDLEIVWEIIQSDLSRIEAQLNELRTRNSVPNSPRGD